MSAGAYKGSPGLRLECELWLADTKPVFDARCARVLEAVEQSGSVHRAAAEFRMSSSWAWRLVNSAEQRLGFALLNRSAGGKRGGGSALTPEGRELLRQYRAALADIEEFLPKVFERYFDHHTVKDPHGAGGDPPDT
jgi:molybdate transport system regulatory protein